MIIPISKFKEINKEFQTLSKHLVGGEININYTYGAHYDLLFSTIYSSLSFKSVSKMYEFCKHIRIPIAGLKITPRATEANSQLLAKLQDRASYSTGPQVLTAIAEDHIKQHKTLKLVPEEIPQDYRPLIIQSAPLEITEGDYTYRLLPYGAKGPIAVEIISRNDDRLYDYLDQGFFYKALSLRKGTKTETVHVVSNAYDVHVAHIFAMCTVSPRLAEMLQYGCFINVHEAEMTRLKMQKKLSDIQKKTYEPISKAIDNDYKKNSTIMVVGKLAAGEIEKTTVNNIAFTKSSAVYEQVSVEADDLMSVLYGELNFNGEFDIYTVASIYSSYIETLLNQSTPSTANVVEGEQPELVEAEDKKALPVFKINGIDITVAVSKTYQRYINDVRINKDEIAQAIHRASCHRTPDDYKLFLKSISRMSIRWHDIIANGLPLKIHSNISREEYSNPEPSSTAPALKFCIDPDDKHIKLQVDKDRNVRVQFSKLIKKADTLNRKTNGKGYYAKANPGAYHRAHEIRGHEWCMSQLVNLLVECCTFDKTTTKEDGSVEVVSEVHISREDIVKLLDVANEHKKAVIARSKEFLATAVKLTNATKISFLGKDAYHVKGSLREYAVVIENAKVYDYETRQYRCIVNDRHYAGAGYDDIAARLLALKNDSVMQNQIGTLKGAAQPGAENVHNDYVPDRDVADKIANVVDKILIKA